MVIILNSVKNRIVTITCNGTAHHCKVYAADRAAAGREHVCKSELRRVSIHATHPWSLLQRRRPHRLQQLSSCCSLQQHAWPRPNEIFSSPERERERERKRKLFVRFTRMRTGFFSWRNAKMVVSETFWRRRFVELNLSWIKKWNSRSILQTRISQPGKQAIGLSSSSQPGEHLKLYE